MKVNEAIQELQKLADLGHGSLELIIVDVRTGVSSSAGIGDVATKNDSDQDGTLCDWEDGREYVSIFADH